MASPWVVNASPLIFLSQVDHLHLLGDLAGEVVVPQAVMAEVQTKGSGGRIRDHVETARGFRIDPERPKEDRVLLWDLGAGESAVLTVATSMEDAIAVLDDRQARRCAESLGVKVVGTLGILMRAKRKGLIPEIKPLLTQLLATGMYLAPALGQAVLDEMDE